MEWVEDFSQAAQISDPLTVFPSNIDEYHEEPLMTEMPLAGSGETIRVTLPDTSEGALNRLITKARVYSDPYIAYGGARREMLLRIDHGAATVVGHKVPLSEIMDYASYHGAQMPVKTEAGVTETAHSQAAVEKVAGLLRTHSDAFPDGESGHVFGVAAYVTDNGDVLVDRDMWRYAGDASRTGHETCRQVTVYSADRPPHDVKSFKASEFGM